MGEMMFLSPTEEADARYYGPSSIHLASSESKASKLGGDHPRTGGIQSQSVHTAKGTKDGQYSRHAKSFLSPKEPTKGKSQTKQEKRPQPQLIPTPHARIGYTTQDGRGSPASREHEFASVARTMPINGATDLRIQVKSLATTSRPNM